MYFVSIDVGAQVAIILLACGPCVVIINLLGQVCTLGRAPCTKETLPEFHERCRVTRHSRVFRGLKGCQRTPGNGASHPDSIFNYNFNSVNEIVFRQSDLLIKYSPMF